MSRAFSVLLLVLVPAGFGLGVVLAPRLASVPPAPAPVCRPSLTQAEYGAWRARIAELVDDR